MTILICHREDHAEMLPWRHCSACPLAFISLMKRVCHLHSTLEGRASCYWSSTTIVYHTQVLLLYGHLIRTASPCASRWRSVHCAYPDTCRPPHSCPLNSTTGSTVAPQWRQAQLCGQTVASTHILQGSILPNSLHIHVENAEYILAKGRLIPKVFRLNSVMSQWAHFFNDLNTKFEISDYSTKTSAGQRRAHVPMLGTQCTPCKTFSWGRGW